MYFTCFYTRLRQSIRFFGSATNWAIAQLGNRFNFPTQSTRLSIYHHQYPSSSRLHHAFLVSLTPNAVYTRDKQMMLISLSTQYERKPLYFHISNVSHRCGLIPTHCTDAVPPAAYTSLRDHLLTLHVQVMLFAQCHFNTGQSVRDLGHFQQFRQRLIEPAAIHMQRCSQNLVKPAPPPYYCGNIVVLFIVLYCIRIATVSCLTCPVTGMTSHTTHRAAWLSGQLASLYSLLFSCSTLPLMHT